MLRVEEALSDHFDQVYLLLKQLNDTTISKSVWKTCFANPFNAEIGHAGYVLMDDKRVVGFFGALFSKRTINGEQVNFCNCHSWIVLPEYRSKGLLLLNRLHKLKDHVLTNFSASDGPYQIMRQLGWQEKKLSYSIVWKRPFDSKRSEFQILSPIEMDVTLSVQEAEIIAHHKSFNCQIWVLKHNEDHCLVLSKEIPYFPTILKKVGLNRLFKLKLGQLYHVSDPEFFFQNFEITKNVFCKKNGWAGLIVADEFMNQFSVPIDRPYMKKRPILFKSTLNFNEPDLDLLYSEIFVLDLN